MAGAADPQGRALVTAAIELARTFGLTTIAEGVETEHQATRVVSLGADLAQGYLWSKPLDADALAALPGLRGQDRRRPGRHPIRSPVHRR